MSGPMADAEQPCLQRAVSTVSTASGADGEPQQPCVQRTSTSPPGLWERRKLRRGSAPVKLQVARKKGSEDAATSSGFHETFTIGPLIGQGSMATVFKVRRNSDGRQQAVKRVCAEDLEIREFTRMEYDVMRKLEHDSIVKAIGFYEDPMELWLCMELCENGCLQSYGKKHGAWSEAKARPLMLQLLQGIDYLHSKRVVHRDLKPQNLLLKAGATQLKIGDFNSAIELYGRGGPVAMLSQRCTPLYCAPEMRLGLCWSERVDVWAGGLCMFYILKAKLPFPDHLVKSEWSDCGSNELPPIEWGGTSPDLRDLVERCLTADGRMRPAAMELLQHPALLEQPEEPSQPESGGEWGDTWRYCNSLPSCGKEDADRSWRHYNSLPACMHEGAVGPDMHRRLVELF